ncbi:MFS transporter [Rubrobacter naiadicus]|uniref:MFS transporter n=1 Tax=Rubrobacter naiadicus TaxID=1392641 RepID=UPI002360C8B3|nr:MFS transporter [Rubrobacter naiadicus]
MQGTEASGGLTRQHWKWTILSSLADYIDAGSIVAGAVGLALWAHAYGMSSTVVGLLGAFSSNAISTGIGALIGGRLGDAFGRKRIYQWDLLVYAFGTLWIIFAQGTWMLFVGYIIMGLAVGADVPTSWSLIAEFSPAKSRGKLMGVTNLFWYIGPIVTLGLALAFTNLGVLGVRLIFVHLFLVAIITWFLRRGLIESERWQAARDAALAAEGTSNPFVASRLRELLKGSNLRALLFVLFTYGVWNLVAGTYGFFYPYIQSTVGLKGEIMGDALQGLWFITAMIGVAFVFMPFNDRFNRRIMYGISATLETIAFLLFVFLPPSNVAVAIANVVLFGFGHGMAAWPLYRVWSVELFPTMVRNTGQGIIFGVMRIATGVWSFFVPAITATGFHNVSIIFSIMLAWTLLLGFAFAPKTEGLSLEEIERQRNSKDRDTEAATQRGSGS